MKISLVSLLGCESRIRSYFACSFKHLMLRSFKQDGMFLTVARITNGGIDV